MIQMSTKKHKVIKPITSNCLKDLIIEMRSPFLFLSFYFPLFSTFFLGQRDFHDGEEDVVIGEICPWGSWEFQTREL